MEDYRDKRSCKAKIGLLFLRDCDGMVETCCVLCGRPICRTHCVESDKGIICPECAATSDQTQKINETDETAAARNRHSYYDSFGYAPYYYGIHHYYSDSDYRTFDADNQIFEEPPDRNGDDEMTESELFDDDDFMES